MLLTKEELNRNISKNYYELTSLRSLSLRDPVKVFIKNNSFYLNEVRQQVANAKSSLQDLITIEGEEIKSLNPISLSDSDDDPDIFINKQIEFNHCVDNRICSYYDALQCESDTLLHDKLDDIYDRLNLMSSASVIEVNSLDERDLLVGSDHPFFVLVDVSEDKQNRRFITDTKTKSFLYNYKASEWIEDDDSDSSKYLINKVRCDYILPHFVKFIDECLEFIKRYRYLKYLEL